MQRYKVFINEHSISFLGNIENATIVDNLFIVTKPSKQNMKVVTDWLLDEETSMNAYFVCSDVDTSWTEFKSLFEIVEAAGGKVKNPQGNILFIHRLGKWDLPKGKIEEGEDRSTAAIREVEEECGISQLTITNQLEPTYHIYRFKDRLALKPTYWFEMNCADNAELIPQTEEAIEKAAWVNPSNLSEQLANTYASLKDVITKAQLS